MKDLQEEKETSGTDSPSVSLEPTQLETLETVITGLSNLTLKLGDLSAELDCLVIRAMKLKRTLQLNSTVNEVSNPGPGVPES